jgi:NAD(P)H-dependent FMN reductase
MSNSNARILAFAGSTRTNSFNKKLAAAAAKAAEAAGAQVTLIDLRDYPMPLYDGDLEAAEGLPEKARALRELFLSHNALIIASPEYNGSYSAVLKNAIDWVSRKQEGEIPLACFKNKIALLLATSPGALGGLRALRHLQTVLMGLQVVVLPEQKSIPKAGEVFNDEGIADDKIRAEVERLGARLAEMASLFHA